MLTTDDFMHAIENALGRALPGREAVARDEVLCELRRLIEAREAEPRACASTTSDPLRGASGYLS
jgi:hypothetical protein